MANKKVTIEFTATSTYRFNLDMSDEKYSELMKKKDDFSNCYEYEAYVEGLWYEACQPDPVEVGNQTIQNVTAFD